MRAIFSLKTFLLCSIFVLSACGGGSGGKSVQENKHFSLFPVGEDKEWVYTDFLGTVKNETPINLSGYEVYPFRYSTGAKEYFHTTESSIEFLGLYIPEILASTNSGTQVFKADAVFSEPVTYYSSDWSVGYVNRVNGKGKINIKPKYGKRALSYSGSVTFLGSENIQTPTGEFYAKKIRVNLRLSTKVSGQSFSFPIDTVLWLVDEIGVAQRVDNGYAESLLYDYSNMPTFVSFETGEGAESLPEREVVTNRNAILSANEGDSIETEYETEGEDWLSTILDGGRYYLQPNTTELSEGTYRAKVKHTYANGEQTTLIVDYKVERPMVSGPSELIFDLQGELSLSTFSQSINFEFNGKQMPLDFVPSADWIKIGEVESDGVSTYKVELSHESLMNLSGQQNENIVVNYDNGYSDNDPLVISIKVNLPDNGLTTHFQEFIEASGSENITSGETLMFFNGDVPADAYSVSIRYSGQTSDWLNIVLDDNSNTYRLFPNTANLEPNMYTAYVEIVSDTGAVYVYEVMYVLEPPQLLLPEEVSWYITAETNLEELLQTITFEHTGELLEWEIESRDNWLSVKKLSNDRETVATASFELIKEQLATLENNIYETSVTVTYQGEYVEPTVRGIRVILDVSFPQISNVLPYVIYENQSFDIVVNGERFDLTESAKLTVAGVEVEDPIIIDNQQIKLNSPALPPGDYRIQISNNLDLERPGGRFIVKPELSYSDAIVELPGNPSSLVYDEEHEAFYGVFWNSNSNVMTAAKIYFEDDEWLIQNIDIAGAKALTLSPDGSELLVTAENCIVRHYEPQTLRLLESRSKPRCYYETLGMIEWLNNDQVFVADTNQWPTLYSYPWFSARNAPSVHNPVVKSNLLRDKFIWAESPSISGARELYVYYSKTNSFQSVLINGEDYFTRRYLSFDADGSRMLHGKSVYDENLNYIGSLESDNQYLATTQPTPDGLKAAMYEDGMLSIHDLSMEQGPFPKIGESINLNVEDQVSAQEIKFSLDGKTAFIFLITGNYTSFQYKMVVKNIE
ncbi:IPT/TIG domain-containing protein [Pleionea sediminis]|uniref:IPT/TIG domain-containing protein n=1 Tax=Pleionea sediminis TaxID=2569479 RepID=UPI0011860076|nr:IPT/TIG domain-containing protein [Pleionea sediminis]